MKIKESKKTEKYMELFSEQKSLWKVRVTVILIVVGALGTVTEGLETRGIGNLRQT